ncbi:UNVERIFIED_CONTAM: hypothetical protein HDU68_007186 [Siphonaria sp. JEL0065]|nr:hypothetical protein HDU68_007186 [Siphonaria sp. JEL0065]
MAKTKSLLVRTSNALFNRIAPQGFAEAWDNVGLLVEAPLPRAAASKVFLTIDLTLETVNEAISDPSVGVIVAYHPPIFSGLKRLTLSDVKQKIVLLCAAHGISVLSPHTSLDIASGGINDWLATGLGEHVLKPIADLDPKRLALALSVNQGESAGIGRIATLAQPASVEEIVKRVKNHLKLSHVRLALPSVNSTAAKTIVKTVAICAGSGHSVCSQAKGVDLYFTGEMSHHEVLEATAKGRAVILCDHTNTERGFLADVLQTKLQSYINEDGGSVVEVVCSKLDADPLVVV